MRFCKSHLLLICLVLATTFQSCKQPAVEYAFRVVRGGQDTIKIDKKTPLNKLILRLEQPWDWINTGAGYWIGYTDDMFSIASYKDKAINPLVTFIKNTDSLHAKIGGLATLHLIGINSNVAGRQYEEFRDSLARKAIMLFIDDSLLQNFTLFLLRRDPWASDIPYFINYLSLPNRDYTSILWILRRYQLFFYFLPMWQPIPEEIYNKKIDIYTSDDDSTSLVCEIIALKNTLKGKVIVDKEIEQSKQWREGMDCFRKKLNHVLILTDSDGHESYEIPRIGREIRSFMYHPVLDYNGDIPNSLFFYSYKNDSLFIYSKETARKLILTFWDSLTNEKIQQLTRTIK